MVTLHWPCLVCIFHIVWSQGFWRIVSCIIPASAWVKHTHQYDASLSVCIKVNNNTNSAQNKSTTAYSHTNYIYCDIVDSLNHNARLTWMTQYMILVCNTSMCFCNLENTLLSTSTDITIIRGKKEASWQESWTGIWAKQNAKVCPTG